MGESQNRARTYFPKKVNQIRFSSLSREHKLSISKCRNYVQSVLENETRPRSVAFEAFPDDPNIKVAKTLRSPFWDWKFSINEWLDRSHTHTQLKSWNAMASIWCHTSRLVVARVSVGVGVSVWVCEWSRTTGNFPFLKRGSRATFSFCLGFSPPKFEFE